MDTYRDGYEDRTCVTGDEVTSAAASAATTTTTEAAASTTAITRRHTTSGVVRQRTFRAAMGEIPVVIRGADCVAVAVAATRAPSAQKIKESERERKNTLRIIIYICIIYITRLPHINCTLYTCVCIYSMWVYILYIYNAW